MLDAADLRAIPAHIARARMAESSSAASEVKEEAASTK
jgi:hypothetical protein